MYCQYNLDYNNQFIRNKYLSNFTCPDFWAPGLLSDQQIHFLATNHTMINPFIDRQVKENNTISYGLSSYGYDARIADEFKIISQHAKSHHPIEYELTNKATGHKEYGITQAKGPMIIDPTDFDDAIFEDIKASEIIIPPHGFILARTLEVFDIPRDILVICMTKSTWARTGLVIGVTPLEAGWSGTVTLELSNTTDLPIRIKAGHGICQFLFYKGSEPCKTSYADRYGKYQNQVGVTLPRV